uniref:Reverse transcriptase Ty1/copia-type domain-containing protein n=1 Tax=Nicotiana tabacum TaxID=4097 RepID=A0A1S3XAQ5_TOBAC|nr:PREDICTED: uncharacterized protein LOC107762959 [Nicotiana tabacum]
MVSKSNAFSLMKAFVAMVKMQFQTSIQTVRSDNALKLGSSTSASQFFVDNAIYLINRFPSVLLQNKTPFELLFPDSSSLPPTPTYEVAPTFSPSPSSISSLSPRSSLPVPSLSSPSIRRSTRPHNPLAHLQNYVCDLSSSLCGSNSCSSCSPPLLVAAELEPYTYHRVASIPAWQEALRKEFEVLEANHTWTIVELPAGKKPIGCNWVYKIKYKADGTIVRYKARKSPNSIILLIVYVDDIILIGDDLDEISVLKTFLENQFKIKSFGSLNYFLGIEVSCFPSGLLIHQRKFIRNLLREYGCEDTSSIFCPLDLSMKVKADIDVSFPSPESYKSLVGKLDFFTYTRPDLSFADQHLSQFLQRPCESHMKAGLHLLRYLKGTSEVGVFFSNYHALSLSIYCDSDWAACLDTKRSVSGFCILMGGCLVGWKAKKQTVVPLSSAEAEYRALNKVVAELTWVIRLLSDFGLVVPTVVHVFCDN